MSDPVGQTEAWHSETLVRLPETFSCYRPPDESPPVRLRLAPDPILRSEAGGAHCPQCAGSVGDVAQRVGDNALQTDHGMTQHPNVGSVFTFGCCNNLAKVTPPMIELWAQVLRDHPAAHLFLKSRGLADPATAARLREDFVRAGVEAERIELNGDELSVARHLDLYNRVDVALDTAPYNGTTTTCETLWMGVQVVTLSGRTLVARVGASLLTHLGAPEWIAASPEEYRARCRALAGDRANLARLRQTLRERMARSPLCNGPRFVGHLEDAFGALWARSAPRGQAGSAEAEIEARPALAEAELNRI